MVSSSSGWFYLSLSFLNVLRLVVDMLIANRTVCDGEDVCEFEVVW